MSRSLQGAVCAAVTVLVLGCRYHPTPVRLQGVSSDISAMAGKWEGEYASTQSQRSGSISFTVRAGTDTAFGDVLMLPVGGQQLLPADAQMGTHALHASQPQLLEITFVRVSAGLVEGALEPYVAPDCRCVVSTVFRGTQRDNVISGEYVTRGEMGLRQTGTWRVERK
jgi:hypothetical protein